MSVDARVARRELVRLVAPPRTFEDWLALLMEGIECVQEARKTRALVCWAVWTMADGDREQVRSLCKAAGASVRNVERWAMQGEKLAEGAP